MNFRVIYRVLVCLALLSPNTVAAEDNPPEVSVDGLHLVHGTQMAIVYAKIAHQAG